MMESSKVEAAAGQEQVTPAGDGGINWTAVGTVLALVVAVGSAAMTFAFQASRVEVLEADLKDLLARSAILQRALDQNVLASSTNKLAITNNATQIASGGRVGDDNTRALAMHVASIARVEVAAQANADGIASVRSVTDAQAASINALSTSVASLAATVVALDARAGQVENAAVDNALVAESNKDAIAAASAAADEAQTELKNRLRSLEAHNDVLTKYGFELWQAPSPKNRVSGHRYGPHYQANDPGGTGLGIHLSKPGQLAAEVWLIKKRDW